MKTLLATILALISIGACAQSELPYIDTPLNTVVVNTVGRYTLQYNPQAKTPSWVAYKLTATDINGKAGRSNSFSIDSTIKARGLPYATNAHYANSGYDKGHLIPSADRSQSIPENKATFSLANVAPQTPNLNRGVWKILETNIRRMTAINDTIYIICGTVNQQQATQINNAVTIPSLFFKALMIRNGNQLEFKAYLFPNNKEVNQNLNLYEVTIDSVEKLTQLKLFFTAKNLRNSKK